MSEEPLSTGNDEENQEDSEDSQLDVTIPDEVEEIIKDLPELQQKAVRAVLLGIQIERRWKAPLPPPDILKEYNDALPNGAERIMEAFEAQGKHRRDLEKIVIPAQVKQSGRGQIFGFIIATLFLLVAGFLIYTGHEISGTVLGTLDLIGLVALFVVGKRDQTKDTSADKLSDSDSPQE